MNKRRILINAMSSVLSYGFLFVFSIISSRLVLVGYGSEMNGLISSVNQLFSYLALLEAGIGTATVRALYRPVVEEDKNGISKVLSASKAYYRSCTKWYFACVVIVSLVWPIVLDTQIPYVTICAIILLQGISGVITFWYTSTALNYLAASGRNYVNNRLHVFATLTSSVVKILICISKLDIIFISVSLICINLVKCFVYCFYMKKNCPEYFVKCASDKSILKQRRSFLVHEISGVVFAGTDTIILSVFCGLREASVYAVFSLVIGALKTIVGQVFSGTNYLLGNSYVKGKEYYMKAHDSYNSIYISGAFSVFSIAYLLLIPFLTIYTNGISDANYVDRNLPLLFVLIELISACRIVDGQLIKTALHAKQTIPRSLAEAGINLVVSLVAVQFIGIYGVLFGTIIALFYRSNDIILYVNKYILNRKPVKEYLLYAVNFALFCCVVLIERVMNLSVGTYFQLVMNAIPISAVVIGCYAVVNYVLFKAFKQ